MASDKFSPSPSKTGFGVWLPALSIALFSVVLMAADARFRFSPTIRAYTSQLALPLWWLASLPARVPVVGLTAFLDGDWVVLLLEHPVGT